MATITASAAGGSWTSGATWIGGVVPTAADDVVLNSSSGNVTINGTSGAPNRCRDLTCTGYTGTLSHPTNTYLEIAGSLVFSAAMTYSTNNSARLSFTSTSSGKTITMAGKQPPPTTFNGVGGGWTLQDSFSVVTTDSTVTLLAGALDTNGQNVSGQFATSGTLVRSLTLGSTIWSLGGTSRSWTVTTTTNFTLSAASSTILFGTTTTGTLNGAGLTFGTIEKTTGGGTLAINGNNTIGTINFSSGTMTIGGTLNVTTMNQNGSTVVNIGLSCVFGTYNLNTTTLGASTILTQNQTIGTLNVSSTARGLIASSTIGAQRSINVSNISGFTRADFRDISGVGSANWDLSGYESGDCGGNSGIIFTAPATLTWNFGNGNWSNASMWQPLSRVPLPQDTARVAAGSFPAANKTLVMDVPRVGSIFFDNATNQGSVSGNTTEVYGDITYTAPSIVGISGGLFTMRKRGIQTITTAGKNFQPQLNIDSFSGTVKLLDNFTSNRAAGSSIASGTFDHNGFDYTLSAAGFVQTGGNLIAGGNMSVLNFTSSVTNSRSFTMPTGDLNLTGTGTIWNTATAVNLTLTKSTSKINITDTSAVAKTFSGGGMAFNDIEISGAAGNADVNFVGSNSFNKFDPKPNASVKFTAGSTTSMVIPFPTKGTAGNPITIGSITAAQHTLSSASGMIVGDYFNISYSNASGGAQWYAGSHANDNGNNNGWIFSDPAQLKIGNVSPSSIYVGSQAVSKVYLGNQLLWSA
jgi:hypothetical protein